MKKLKDKKQTCYYNDFRSFLNDVSQKYADKPAITTYDRRGTAHVHSYRDLSADATRFALALCSAGLSEKHIALAGENSYEWLVSYFGIVSCGGVVICIDIEQSDETIGQAILRADAEVVIASDSMATLCSAIRDEHGSKLRIISFGDQQGCENFEMFCSLGDGNGQAQMLYDAVKLEKKRTASIVYTSGTTSTAKPVMLSHYAILCNAADSLTLLSSGERVFNTLPLYHTYGLTCSVLCSLIRGVNVCLSCDLKRMMQELTNSMPNMVVSVPLIIESLHKLAWYLIDKSGKKNSIIQKMKLEALLRRPFTLTAKDVKAAIKGSCLENLEFILSGGAYLSPEVAKHLEHFGIVVLQGYGITECSPSISCNRNEDYKLDSVGVVLPHFEVKIKDGEILVRGDSLMNGYYKAPELTAESFDDGWFKTGDLGYMDRKGYLYLTGRKKNLIVMKNGKKIAAEEMEETIRKMPLVKDVVVYGAQSGSSADDVKIAAMVYPDPKLTEHMTSYEILEQLQKYVDQLNAKLPSYKQIQMLNIRETDFSRTSSQKIKRQTI